MEAILQTYTHIGDPEQSTRLTGLQWDEGAKPAAEGEERLHLEIQARVLAPFVAAQRKTGSSNGGELTELPPGRRSSRRTAELTASSCERQK